MLSEEAILQSTLSKLITGFGKNHAKVYSCLVDSAAKSSKQIQIETQLAKNTAYTILNDLVEKQLINQHDNTPKLYYCEPIMKTVRKLIKKRKTEYLQELETILQELEPITRKTIERQEFLLRVEKARPTLLDNQTKKPLEYKHEIDHIKELLDKIPGKNKQKQWQIVNL